MYSCIDDGNGDDDDDGFYSIAIIWLFNYNTFYFSFYGTVFFLSEITAGHNALVIDDHDFLFGLVPPLPYIARDILTTKYRKPAKFYQDLGSLN